MIESNLPITKISLNALVQETSSSIVTKNVLNVLVPTPTLVNATPPDGSIVDTNEYVEVAFSSTTENVNVYNTNEYVEVAFSTKPKAVVSQIAVEVLASVTDKKIRRDLIINY